MIRNYSLLTNRLTLFKKLLAETDATPRNTQYPNIKDTNTSTLITIFTLLAVTLKDLFFLSQWKVIRLFRLEVPYGRGGHCLATGAAHHPTDFINYENK